ncbi:CHAP domain-containing protein [Streptococcus sp. zg-JUN1979]|uniref:CHAP domain-containing protein n=1 Tax=Streptococcus sp. zg-JUN1979 TaxID=3391450 RepID=UPI0039A6608F
MYNKRQWMTVLMLSSLVLPSLTGVVSANELTSEDSVVSISKDDNVEVDMPMDDGSREESPAIGGDSLDESSKEPSLDSDVTEPSIGESQPSVDEANQESSETKEEAASQEGSLLRPSLSYPTVNSPILEEKVTDSDEDSLEQAFLPSSVSSQLYVNKWSTGDAYTHNLLTHRYGITAEQLDGFLETTGIAYDKARINGEKLLAFEEASGMDVRAIVAIAIAESALGTQGAAVEGANMFGYGIFEKSSSQEAMLTDEEAICALVETTIINEKNTSFKRQDDKARLLALGQLDVASEGGIYFSDTSGTGKRRSEIMESLDDWIDSHGGTPEIQPTDLINAGISLSDLPEGYHLSKAIDASCYTVSSYPYGQCTWYAYHRARELGYSFDAYMGNGADWQYKSGYETTREPAVGYVVSFLPGQAGADAQYGHVAIVEAVNPDGSILISESNVMGLGRVSYRIFSAQEAKTLSYVIGHSLT